MLMQHFRKKGFKTENLYVLKAQHDLLKEKIYSDRFRCHKNERGQKELCELELSNDKVDHPVDGSKDTADGLAGVAWNCFMNGDSGVAAAGVTQHTEEEKDERKDNFGFRSRRIQSRRKSIWERSLV